MIPAIAISLLLLALPVRAQQVEVRNLRLWTAPDQTRLVVDLAAPVEHKVFRLDEPHRLVIDIPDARFRGKLPAARAEDPLVQGVRSGIQEGDDLRLVLDLGGPVKPKSFLLAPNQQYGHRLVIDLFGGGAKEAVAPAVPREVQTSNQPSQLRDLVIAIDAGHGGEDPGARGRKGTREKDVVLEIARRLAALIEKEPGMRPVMIRDGDYYIGLRKRIEKARSQRADLFISIHADAFRDSRARGSSVYVLSQRGASSEMARWLAARENAADLVGGVSLDDKDDLLAEADFVSLHVPLTDETMHMINADVIAKMKDGVIIIKAQQHRSREKNRLISSNSVTAIARG